MTKMLIATADAFTKEAKFVARGQVINANEVDWEKGDAGFVEAPSGINANAVTEVSAIAPTGPNPKNPQQIAPGTVQTPEGWTENGARLVGEVTVPEKQRIKDAGIDLDDDTQAKITEALAKADAEEPRRAAAERTRARRTAERTDAENSG